MNYIFSTIPAPSFDSIGFIQIYGITMAIGMGVGAIVAHKRYNKIHPGSSVVIDIFLPTVICGIIGARVYHLFTGYDWDANGISGTVNLRAGGLSIWGAVIGGAVAVYVQSRMKNISFIEIGAAVVPGLAIAQAIGRLGNYFNQELFGRPLDAFWALEVDVFYRPVGYEAYETFHPTFLYEMLWCLIIALLIVVLEKRIKSWSALSSIAAYAFLYTLGRTFFEWLRIDNASLIFGVRFNLLLSAVLSCIACFVLIKSLRMREKLQDIKDEVLE